MENMYLNRIVLDKINKKSNSISEKCEIKINYSSVNSFCICLYLSTGGGRQTEVTRCFRGRPASVTGATRTRPPKPRQQNRRRQDAHAEHPPGTTEEEENRQIDGKGERTKGQC